MSKNGRPKNKKPRPKKPVQLPRPVVRQRDLVGTAEAAEILQVERPRIGRWIQRGIMPDMVCMLAATPVWERRHIERMRPWVEDNRRNRSAKVAS